MLTRRQLLERGVIGGAGLLVPWTFKTAAAAGAPGIKSYATDLAAYFPPAAVRDAAGNFGLDVVATTVPVHGALPSVPVWSYRDAVAKAATGAYPTTSTYLGPTIVVDKHEEPDVSYVGALAAEASHLFAGAIDEAVLDPYVSDPNASDMRFLTHLHGAFVDGENDGNPFATHYANGTHTHHEFGPQDAQLATYPAQDRAAMIWYHQHSHGITHLNVMAGLAGAYLIADEIDTLTEATDGAGRGLGYSTGPFRFPAGPFHLPLVLQDRSFAGGRLAYPEPEWVPEFFGDTTLVNGAVEPFLRVEARRYRFRLLNGSNARFYNLAFGRGARGATAEMWVIGGDGGLLETPVQVPSLVLAPGERADVIVDFGNLSAGDKVLLQNLALPAGVVSPAPSLPNVMRFDITAPTSKDLSFKPSRIGTITTDTPQRTLTDPVAKRRNMILEEVMGPAGPLASIINFRSFEGRPVKYWTGPPAGERYPFDLDAEAHQLEDVVDDGDTEEWRFVNATADTHPMHLHLVQFGLVSRQQIDAVAFQNDLMNLHMDRPLQQPGAAVDELGRPDPEAYLVPGTLRPATAFPSEAGWKDTIRANPGEVTTIRAKFDTTGFSGDQDYVFHCHILEHESNSMMRAYRVRKAG